MTLPRYCFTLAYQAAHLFAWRDWLHRTATLFDRWVLVEGAAHPGGSTAWCRPHPGPAQSADGTREALLALQAAAPDRVTVILGPPGGWPGKDDMVRAAVDALRDAALPAYLWELDADEHWTAAQLAAAEAALTAAGADCGEFLCEYYLGPGLVARGEWGEGRALPYRRLWRWHGQQFARHEPPELAGGNGHTVLLPQRFEHFAYYFERDVAFKARYYGGHQGVLAGWRQLNADRAAGRGPWPRPIGYFFGTGPWARSRTTIHAVPLETSPPAPPAPGRLPLSHDPDDPTRREPR